MKITSKFLLFILLFGLSVFLIQAVQEAPTDAIVERKMINDYNIYDYLSYAIDYSILYFYL